MSSDHIAMLLVDANYSLLRVYPNPHSAQGKLNRMLMEFAAKSQPKYHKEVSGTLVITQSQSSATILFKGFC